MTIVTHDTYKELLPAEGKTLFDGRDTASKVAMPLNADHSRWMEIDESAEDDEITAEEALEIITGQ